MKIVEGIVKSMISQNNGVIEVTRKVPHKIYKKLIKKTSTFNADLTGGDIKIGDKVRIVEVRPISKNKTFKLLLSTKKEGKK